jgi:ribosome-binding protein aMBF1 (putative translation factor)
MFNKKMEDDWQIISKPLKRVKKPHPHPQSNPRPPQQVDKPQNQEPFRKIVPSLLLEKRLKTKEVTLEFRQELERSRSNHNMTRQQLADKINEKLYIINGLENGTIIPQGNIIHKLNKELGITLPKLKKVDKDI